MKQLILIVTILFFSTCIFSQTENNSGSEADLHKEKLSQKTSILKLNVTDINQSKINDLTIEYRAWSEKIISIDLDRSNMILSIKHNHLWQQQEINEMLAKYNISGKKIISHK